MAAHLPAPIRSAATGAAAVLSLVLAVSANHRDLDFRTYDFATIYGRVHLQNLDPGAILVLNSDDALSICGYLQRVKEERTDVALVTQSFLGLSFVGDRDWYDARLLKSHPFLKPPDYAAARNRLTGVRPLAAHLAAFLEANAGSGHPIFTQTKLPPSLLPRGTVQVPAGVLWKLAPLGQDKVDFRYWSFAMNPEDVQGRVRRERGLKLTRDAEGLHSQAEAYETRLLNLLLKGQYALADVCLDTGRPVEAVRLLEAVRAMDPDYDAHPAFLYSLARAYQAAGDASRAEAGYQRALSIGLGPPLRGWAFCFLGELCAKKGRQEQAEICYTQASQVAGEDAPLRARLDKNTPPKTK